MSRGAREKGRGIVATLLSFIAALLFSASAAQVPAPAPAYVEKDSVRVVFWGDGSSEARRTLEAATTGIRLPGLGTQARLHRATIFLPETPEAFDSLTGGDVPGWAAGVAIPSANAIVLPPRRGGRLMPDDAITLRHEIVHLALRQNLGSRIPRWFDEGYATWVSGGWDEGSGWVIRLALLRGTAAPLDSLTLSWPAGESRARLAYLLSASAVRYLATSRGEQAFSAFLDSWRQGGTLAGAMRSVYQITPEQFEREWRRMVRREYGWLLAISQMGVFWGGVTLLVLILGTLRRRRNRERLEEMRREEYMLPASTGDGVDLDIDRGSLDSCLPT